jgi:hypothetical protein
MLNIPLPVDVVVSIMSIRNWAFTGWHRFSKIMLKKIFLIKFFYLAAN